MSRWQIRPWMLIQSVLWWETSLAKGGEKDTGIFWDIM